MPLYENMTYLDSEYRLAQVTDEEYFGAVKAVAVSKKLSSMRTALRLALGQEDPELANIVEGYAVLLHTCHGNGGGMYSLAVAASINALRIHNPTIRPITALDWDHAQARESELYSRPSIETVEQLSGIGLLEIRDVNSGYVDGFQTSFQRPGFLAVIGITGLAALHSHDLMHFASQC